MRLWKSLGLIVAGLQVGAAPIAEDPAPFAEIDAQNAAAVKSPAFLRSLPPWATSIKPLETDLTFAFLNLANLDERGLAACRFTRAATILGTACGYCQNDCELLWNLTRARVVEQELADVVLVTPEMNRKNRELMVAELTRLPVRRQGSFFLVHKKSSYLTNEDCGRLVPPPAAPPAAMASSAGALPLLPQQLTSPEPAPAALPAFCELLLRRPDVVWLDVDLGEHDLDDDEVGARVRGITLPPGERKGLPHARYRGNVLARFGPQQQPKALVWFRGKCHAGEWSKCHSSRPVSRAPPGVLFSPARCTREQAARAARLGGRTSHARKHLFRAFWDGVHNNTIITPPHTTRGGGGDGGGYGFGVAEVVLEWTGRESANQCPGVSELPATLEIIKTTTPTTTMVTEAAVGSGVVEGKSRAVAMSYVADEFAAYNAGADDYAASLATAWFGFCPHGEAAGAALP